MRSLSASTQRVEIPMEWLLDKNKAWTREIWPFEAAGALGTVAVAKAQRG